MFRLTRSTDFKRVRRFGKSYAHPLVVLVISPNPLEQVRIGVVAGTRVGKAVQRNLVKRRMRAVLHELQPKLLPGYDLIFLARQPMQQASFVELQAALQTVLKRAGVLQKVEESLS